MVRLARIGRALRPDDWPAVATLLADALRRRCRRDPECDCDACAALRIFDEMTGGHDGSEAMQVRNGEGHDRAVQSRAELLGLPPAAPGTHRGSDARQAARSGGTPGARDAGAAPSGGGRVRHGLWAFFDGFVTSAMVVSIYVLVVQRYGLAAGVGAIAVAGAGLVLRARSAP